MKLRASGMQLCSPSREGGCGWRLPQLSSRIVSKQVQCPGKTVGVCQIGWDKA